MAINYSDSLARLRSRRLGYDRNVTAQADALFKSERYESRASSSATRYALGAMQAVDPDYTRICLEEGDRVAEQIRGGLASLDRSAEYRLQGSVPLDVHIRGASDVDLLVLHGRYITFISAGPRAAYYTPTPGPIIDDVIQLRTDCEDILSRRNWGAKVDKTGSKAIKLSGGAFRRQVDVVPSHWKDTAAYQSSASEHDRGVCILDKSVPRLLDNMPFLHMKRINDKDAVVNGGAKMAIRLMKNLKADSSQAISLSSYDIASLAWNCPDELLSFSWMRELSVLVGIERYITRMAADEAAAGNLVTPDGTRLILDAPGKHSSLASLAAELSALVEAIESELRPALKSAVPDASERRRLLQERAIPA